MLFGESFAMAAKSESQVAISRLYSKLQAQLLAYPVMTSLETITDEDLLRTLFTLLAPPVRKKLLPVC